MNIEGTKFGSITIDGVTYKHDVYIHINRTIEKRQKQLSKPYSRGHTVLGPDEIKLLLKEKPKTLVIGKGQRGILPIPKESRALIEKSKVIVIENKTPVVIHMLNSLIQEKAKVVAILHVTC